MATKSHKPKGVRLGTRFRGKLAAAYGVRGAGSSSLWYVYSPRTRSDWVLRSDLEWDHFVLAESDPDIVDCRYSPDHHVAKVNGEDVPIQVDATITRRDGAVEWRRVQFSRSNDNDENDVELQHLINASRVLGRDLSRWTEASIRRNPLLLANWRRVIAWQAAARDRSLSDYEHDLAAAFKSVEEFSLRQVEEKFGEAAFSLYAAALFGALQRGRYRSDLDAMPLSLQTIIRPGTTP